MEFKSLGDIATYVDITLKNNNLHTAFDLARHRSHTECAKILIYYGQIYESQTESRFTERFDERILRYIDKLHCTDRIKPVSLYKCIFI